MGSAHAYNHSYYNSGLAKAKLGDLPGAASDFGLAIAHDPTDAVAFKDRGDVRLRLGDLVGALGDFSEAVQLDRRYARAQGLLGYTRFRTGDLHGALADCGGALAEDPTETCALSTRGLALAQLAQLARGGPERGFERKQTDDFFLEAVGDCEEAVRLEPGNAAALAHLAYVRLLSGDIEGACADSQLALNWDPCDCDARVAYAGVLAAQGDLRRGICECFEALRSDPGNPLATERLRTLQDRTSRALGTPASADEVAAERLQVPDCERDEVATERLGPNPIRCPLQRVTPRAAGRQRDLAFSLRDDDDDDVSFLEFSEDTTICASSDNCVLFCMPEAAARKRGPPRIVTTPLDESLPVTDIYQAHPSCDSRDHE